MKQDIRIEKTLSSLTGAFLYLIEQKPLEKLSVTEICSMARVSRVTYYNYFRDVYDQYDYLKNEYYEASTEYFGDEAYPLGIEEVTEKLRNWLEVLDGGDLGRILAAIVRTQGVLGFLEEYHRKIGSSVLEALKLNDAFTVPPGIQPETVVVFYEGGWATLILKWLSDVPRVYSSEEIAGCIIGMILNNDNAC